MSLAVLLLLFSAAMLSGQTLSRSERDIAMSHLHASRKMFLDSMAGLSESQWKFKPSPDRWSIAECAEHITATEESVLNLITQKLMKTPPAPEKKTEVAGKDDLILKAVPDRSRRVQAPESLTPTGRWSTQEELTREFKLRRDRTIAYAEQTSDDLRSHFAPHPALKLMDGYQWLLFLAAHCERHTAQIQEVKASPSFPAH